MDVLITEDEKLSAEHLLNLLKRIDPEINVIKTVDSVKRCVEYLQEEPKLDLIFMDIHLADGLSFDVFSKLSVETPVIFTTAYNEYAVKAFKVNSIDYLLKPIGIEELRQAIDKFKKRSGIDGSQKKQLDDALHIINKQYKSRFLVKMGETIASVKSQEINHFIAEDGIVLLVTSSGKRYPVDYTLDQIETLLDPANFFRISRKVVLHIEFVTKVVPYFNSRLKVQCNTLNEDDSIVSRERVSDFKAWLDK